MKIFGISFLLGVVCLTGAHAQAVIGSGIVTGTVRDYTGSGIPDTTVILSNERLGVRRTMDTTDDGGFSTGTDSRSWIQPESDAQRIPGLGL